MGLQKKYSTYITFRKLSDREMDVVSNLFLEQNLIAHVYNNAVDFDFSGRDYSDQIVNIFIKIAKIVGDADGYVICELTYDDQFDPEFLFYSIKNSQLWVEHGKVIRSEKELVVEKK